MHLTDAGYLRNLREQLGGHSPADEDPNPGCTMTGPRGESLGSLRPCTRSSVRHDVVYSTERAQIGERRDRIGCRFEGAMEGDGPTARDLTDAPGEIEIDRAAAKRAEDEPVNAPRADRF